MDTNRKMVRVRLRFAASLLQYRPCL